MNSIYASQVDLNNRRKYYEEIYPKVFNSGVIGRVMDLQHKSLEWGLKEKSVQKILELGSGKSNHIRFVKQEFLEYHETDRHSGALPERIGSSSIKQYELDATNLDSISNDEYDRIIISCLLIHIEDIQGALSQWLRILKSGGTLSILIPCEPGGVLRFARIFSTRRKAARSKYDYDAYHFSEHKSYFLRAKYYVDSLGDQAVINWFFYPFCLPSWNLNLWSVVQMRKK